MFRVLVKMELVCLRCTIVLNALNCRGQRTCGPRSVSTFQKGLYINFHGWVLETKQLSFVLTLFLRYFSIKNGNNFNKTLLMSLFLTISWLIFLPLFPNPLHILQNSKEGFQLKFLAIISINSCPFQLFLSFISDKPFPNLFQKI